MYYQVLDCLFSLHCYLINHTRVLPSSYTYLTCFYEKQVVWPVIPSQVPFYRIVIKARAINMESPAFGPWTVPAEVRKGVLLGDSEGARLGSMEGKLVGSVLGLEEGVEVGSELGFDEGSELGLEVGLIVGLELGDVDGKILGESLGNLDGDPEGLVDGALLGLEEGLKVGFGEEVGPAEGLKLREG